MRVALAKNRIAFLLLILIVVGATIAVLNRHAMTNRFQASSGAQSLQLEIPDSAWERAFFEALQERTKTVGLPSLRTVVLPDQDLEVRFWYERLEVISGVVLRRSGTQWSASWIYQKQDSVPSSAQLVKLDAPKSGWQALWQELVNAGILTLPDSHRAGCETEALDGVSLIVETNLSRKYRTYMYSNPQLLKCSEAKQMVQLEEILRREFSLDSRKR